MDNITEIQIYDGLCNARFLEKLQFALEARMANHEDLANMPNQDETAITTNLRKAEIFARMTGHLLAIKIVSRNQELVKERKKGLKKALNRVLKAAIANSWKGGGDPQDIPLIEKELEDAQRKLYQILGIQGLKP